MNDQSVINATPVLPTAPRPWSLSSGSQLLLQSWRLVRERISALIGVIAVPTLLVIISNAAGIGTNTVDYKNWPLLSLLASIVILGLTVSFIKTWVDVALLWVIVSPRERVSVLGAYSASLKLILPFWWVSILAGLVTLGGMIPFLLPGIIVSVWFGFSKLLVVTDNLKGFQAMTASRTVTRGSVVAILLREIFLAIVLLIAVAPFWILGWVLNLAWIKSAIEVAAFFLSPLVTAYQFFLFNSLRKRPDVVIAPATRKSKAALFLLAVWGILGVILVPLALILVAVRPLTMQKRAQDAERQSLFQSLKTSLDIYRLEKGTYPQSLRELMPEYSSQLPSASSYQYNQMRGGKGYRLCQNIKGRQSECIEAP